MLAPLGKLSDSVAYREILAEGEVKGQIKMLEGLRAKGLIDQHAYEEQIAPLRHALAEKETLEDLIRSEEQ